MNHHTVTHGNIGQGTFPIDIATRNIVCLTPCDSVVKAARIMTGYRQGACSLFSLPSKANWQSALNPMQSHRDTCIEVGEAERSAGILTEHGLHGKPVKLMGLTG